jgi:hypothetical protein
LTNPIVDFVMDNLNQNMNIRNQHVTLTWKMSGCLVGHMVWVDVSLDDHVSGLRIDWLIVKIL